MNPLDGFDQLQPDPVARSRYRVESTLLPRVWRSPFEETSGPILTDREKPSFRSAPTVLWHPPVKADSIPLQELPALHGGRLSKNYLPRKNKVMAAIAFTKIRVTKEDITLSLLTGVGLSFLLIWNLYPFIGKGQVYKDFIVGALIWPDYDKDQEWRALNLLFAGFVFFSIGMTALFHYLRTIATSEKWISAIRQLFWLAWLPAVFWFGTALMRPNMPIFWLNVSGVLILLVASLSLIIAKRPEDISHNEVMDAGYSSILILMLSVFSVLGVIVIASQFSMSSRVILMNKGDDQLVMSGILLAMVFIYWNMLSARSWLHKKRLFHNSLLLLQIPVPLLLFTAVSQYYVYQGSIMPMYQSRILIAAIGALVFFSWYKLYRRYQRAVPEKMVFGDLTYRDMLSPASLYPIPIYIGWVFFSMNTYSFVVDDFHIGEQLLPWQQIVEFARLPYADFAPIHGLMAIAYGGLNALFYDNTVATFPLAMLLLMAVFVGLSFWAVYSFIGPWPALILTPFYGATMNRIFILLPVLLLFCQLLSGKYKTALWLPLWILLSFISVLYNVPVGSGLVLGSIPVVLYRGWLDYQEDKTWFRFFLLASSACALGILIISPLREIAFGLMHFIFDNASTNTAANGVGMFQEDMRPKEVGFAATQFQWIFLKMSWIVVVIAAVVLSCRTLVSRDNRPDSKYLVLVLLIPITFFFVSKWSSERVSVTEFNGRDGSLSFLSLVFILPLILDGFGSGSTRFFRHLASAFMIGVATSVAGIGLDYKAVLNKPFLTDVVSDKDALFIGEDIGLPRLGKLFAEPKRIAELQSLRKTMASFLKPGETFLDLTNRSALYYYLDKPVPVLYSADYVAANVKSLTRMIEQIKDNPPPLVLITPRIFFDGGPASLRSYPLYKELVTSYVPQVIGDHTFLVRPDRIRQTDIMPMEEQLTVLDPVFRARDLYTIPDIWGRSWNILKKRFSVLHRLNSTGSYHFAAAGEGRYRPTGEDPQILFDIGQYKIAGKDADFLLLDYSCERQQPGPAPIIELYWGTENELQSEKTVLRFIGSGTKALIPVGAQPRWQLAKRIEALRLDLQDHTSCSELRIKGLEVLKLNQNPG